jgi:outer membrane protein assembly factor BamB
VKKLAGFLLAILLFSCHTISPILWRVRLQSRSYADPVLDGDRAFVVSAAGEVFCISLSDGSSVWTARTDSPVVASPAVSDRALFVGTQDGSVFSFDKKSGSQIWRRKFSSDEGFESPLSMLGQNVLAPSIDGKLYALSRMSGQTVWVHTGTGKYTAAPIVSGTHIFLGGWGGDFFCIREDGQEEWRFKAASRIVDAASVKRNIVYVPTHGHFLYALDAPSGRLLWRFEAVYPTSAVLTEDFAVFASSTLVYVVRLQDGNLLRKIEMEKTILNVRPASNGCLVVTDQAYRLDPSTGSISVIRGLPRGQKPFKIAESRFCYIITDDLYSVFCIRK